MESHQTWPVVLAASITLGSAACAASDMKREEAIAVDSAGVQIIQNTMPVWRPGEEWRLAAEPVLEIGAEEGPPHYAFGYAHSPVRLSDGRIVVADMQTNLMHFYDATGEWLKTTGGTGKGPGEFEQLYRMRRIAGDSLMALNPASLTSIFAPSGEYARRFDLDPVPRRGNLWWLGRLSDNTLVTFSLERKGTIVRPAQDSLHEGHFDRPEKPAFYRDSLLYMLFTMEGQLIDSIAELPGQWQGESRVFVPNAAHAFVDDVFYHSPGDAIEIRAFRSLAAQRQATSRSPEAPTAVMRLERIIRSVPPRDLTVTDDLKEQHFAVERARYDEMLARGFGGDRAAFERRLADTPFPERIPAHANRMYADAVGNLWLQEYAPGTDGPLRWLVFDTTGRWLGTVETPPRFTLNEIGADYMLGISRDSLDVQYVRMYRLEKPGR